MWLNLRTEYSFGAVYGPDKQVAMMIDKISKNKAAGIADINGTWGHIRWAKVCKEVGIKPIFGVRLCVASSPALKERRQPFDMMSFIAMNSDGLKEIYNLVDIAHRQFYYKPLLSYHQINEVSKNVTIIASYSPRYDLLKRQVFLELSPSTPLASRNIKGVDYIACCDNWYMSKDDELIYEPFADSRKREKKTSPMHILTDKEWKKIYPDRKEALKNRDKISKSANAELTNAHMVRYNKKENIETLALAGAKERGVDLTKKKYRKRFNREMDLIREKDYVDYFLVVADLVHYAKTKMLVGHARGSSAGSLVCYCLGITEIDPIPYGLVFERFIDLNRMDLPDIDIDFQDNKRHLVIKYLQKQYGQNNVAQIGSVSRLKPKSALTRFAKSLQIPLWEVDEVKDAIVEKSSGDARAGLSITDAFIESDVGAQFIKEYPNMMAVSTIENHASHTGVHAAGILVCNEPITNYCGINSRGGDRVAMLDKKGAESINLLKIDALALRTLTIIAEICDAVGIPYSDLYTIDLTDKAAYKVFKQQRLTGIFQFEGDAVRNLAKQMPVEDIYDISALSALGRPGPLATGGATTFTNRRSGKEDVVYMSEHPEVVKEIKDTFGVIIYQEQVMNIGRNYGGLSWEDVSELRKAMSGSKGDEFFGKYKKKFVKGAVEKGATKKDANKVWKNMNSMGSWSFNKSHSVSYGMITYLCAYMKAHHPLQFAVASLNNAKDDKSALKLLRDLKENEGIEYKPFSKYAVQRWSIRKGKLIAGLLTIDDIGPVNANKIVKMRAEGTTIPIGIRNKLSAKVSPFKYLYPAKEIYGDYYLMPEDYGVETHTITTINMMDDSSSYCIIGMLTKKVIRDANEAILVSKRGGKRLDGPTAYINMTFEDDTESVLATVGREDYEEFGKEIAESGKLDHDWYLIYGRYNPEWNKIYIKNIRRITRQ